MTKSIFACMFTVTILFCISLVGTPDIIDNYKYNLRFSEESFFIKFENYDHRVYKYASADENYYFKSVGRFETKDGWITFTVDNKVFEGKITPFGSIHGLWYNGKGVAAFVATRKQIECAGVNNESQN